MQNIIAFLTYLDLDKPHTRIQVSNNLSLLEKIKNTSIEDADIIMQLSHIGTQTLDEFKLLVNELVKICQTSNAKFLMFRCDAHEENSLHRKITEHLKTFPEFAVLQWKEMTKPEDVNQKLCIHIWNYWEKLYKNKK
jgi:hypothetical protein